MVFLEPQYDPLAVVVELKARRFAPPILEVVLAASYYYIVVGRVVQAPGRYGWIKSEHDTHLKLAAASAC